MAEDPGTMAVLGTIGPSLAGAMAHMMVKGTMDPLAVWHKGLGI